MTTQHAGFFQHLDKQEEGGKKKIYKITAIELGVQCTRNEYSKKKKAVYFY